MINPKRVLQRGGIKLPKVRRMKQDNNEPKHFHVRALTPYDRIKVINSVELATSRSSAITEAYNEYKYNKDLEGHNYWAKDKLEWHTEIVNLNQ